MGGVAELSGSKCTDLDIHANASSYTYEYSSMVTTRGPQSLVCDPRRRPEASRLCSFRRDIVLLVVTQASEQVSLADAKARLSEVIEGIEIEHRRVVITKHGRPSVVVLAVEDLEALEDTLEVLSDADAVADLREAAAARRTGQTIELTKEEALYRWSRG